MSRKCEKCGKTQHARFLVYQVDVPTAMDDEYAVHFLCDICLENLASIIELWFGTGEQVIADSEKAEETVSENAGFNS